MRPVPLIAISLLSTGALLPQAASASTIRSAQRPPMAASARPQLIDANFIRFGKPPRVGHERVSASPSRDDPTQLGIYSGAFSPAQVSSQYSGVADDATADKTRLRNFHTASYSTFGRTTGYYEYATYTPASADPVTFEYLGSYYGSSAQANSAFQDATNFFAKQGITGSHLNYTDNANLYTFSTSYNGTTYVFALEELQIGRCTAETVLYSTDADLNHNQQVEQDTGGALNAIDHAAVSAMQANCMGASSPQSTPTPVATATSTPTPAVQPSVSITDFALLHRVKKKVKTTKVLKLKEAGLFVFTFKAQNADGLTPSATITIDKGSREIGGGQMKEDTFSDGTTYFYAAAKFKQKKSLGHLVAHVKVIVGSASDSRSLKFTLKKKK